jgi:multidrug efflux pump subunit AcrA (membrane-fusion protein)
MLTTAEMKDLKPEHAVRLKADGSGDERLGRLVRVDEQTHATLGQTEALVEFAYTQHRVAIGTFLAATFLIGESKPVLVVPKTALLTAADGTFVYAVNGEHFTRTKIKVGAATDRFVEVEDGLYSGDMVVVKGVESLWLIELSALKGGKPCCAVPKKETALAK